MPAESLLRGRRNQGVPDMVMDAAMQAGQSDAGLARISPCSLKNKAVALFVPPKKLPRRTVASGRLTPTARRDFLDALALCGDPAVAAERLGLGLARLVRLRADDAEFAAQWQAAIGFAWERVEHRLLAQLLDPAAVMDSKLALAAIARRDQGLARVQAPRVDSDSVARLRAELRSLTGPDAAPHAPDVS